MVAQISLGELMSEELGMDKYIKRAKSEKRKGLSLILAGISIFVPTAIATTMGKYANINEIFSDLFSTYALFSAITFPVISSIGMAYLGKGKKQLRYYNEIKGNILRAHPEPIEYFTDIKSVLQSYPHLLS